MDVHPTKHGINRYWSIPKWNKENHQFHQETHFSGAFFRPIRPGWHHRIPFEKTKVGLLKTVMLHIVQLMLSPNMRFHPSKYHYFVDSTCYNLLSATLTFAQTHDCDIAETILCCWEVAKQRQINFIFMGDQNPPPPMTNTLNGLTTSTLSSWGIKICHPLWPMLNGIITSTYTI